MLTKAMYAMASRPVFRTEAKPSIKRFTGGELAAT